ncbi:octanoyl-[acyl-carrier-protein]:protein N-octanoyltransferase LIPT2, mitochondrial [Onthophagus taurus]|uniref:octanoyl-[acyl-carrier-protein]:protein N-octanoyltransferase LIPT2, mitochondrial n=1 Tax=Onthophagus taurus TaxID=166361 RepID=UPI0039BDB444
MTQNLIKIVNAGKLSYLKSLNLQESISNNHKASINNKNEGYNNKVLDTLILVEHPPVYTIGLRTNNYTIEDETRLKQTGADFFKTNRGGLITFHGPGQLVVYPILNLKNYNPSMKWYINKIEEVVIQTCNLFDLESSRSPHTGVWIGNNKICAIGVHGSRFITTHGLAINCNVNLDWYKHIVPCGIEGKGVTSFSKELNRVVLISEVIPKFLESFSKCFNCKFDE